LCRLCHTVACVNVETCNKDIYHQHNQTPPNQSNPFADRRIDTSYITSCFPRVGLPQYVEVDFFLLSKRCSGGSSISGGSFIVMVPYTFAYHDDIVENWRFKVSRVCRPLPLLLCLLIVSPLRASQKFVDGGFPIAAWMPPSP